MSDSFEFREVTHFTAGAIGEPGRRVFYLQVGDGMELVTVKLEKQQVEALARFLRGVLDDLPAEPGEGEAVPLASPAEASWTVGQIAVGIDESAGKVVLVIEEISAADEEDEDDDPILGGEPDLARVQAHIGVGLAAAFVATSEELMSQGRPPCRLCGQPMDPAGHACPRLN